MSSNSLARNTILIYLRMFVVLLITLYTSRVLLNVLGFSDYGLYQLVAGIVVLFSFLKQALTNSSFRYIAYAIGEDDTEEARRVFSSAINCYAILAIIVFLILEILGVWFINNKLNISQDQMKTANILFQTSIVTFCLGVITSPLTSSILAHERMDYYAIVGIVEVLLKLLAVFALNFVGENKVIIYGYLLVLVGFIVFSLSAIYCYFQFASERYCWYWDIKRIKKLLSYSSWSILVNGADIGSQQAINIFFNIFIGVVGNAAIGITNQVFSGVNQFVSNICQAFNPRIIKSYASKNYNYFFSLIYSASKISYVLYILIALPIMANTEFILDFWLDSYPPHTANYIRIILLSLMFDSFQMPLWLAVHATGKLSVHQSVIGGIRLLSIPVIYLVFKHTCSGELALAVSAMTTAICAVFRTIYLHFLVRLDLKDYFFKVILRLFLLTIFVTPIVCIASSISDNKFGSLILSFVISSLLTLICSMLFVFGQEEKKKLARFPIIGKIINRGTQP